MSAIGRACGLPFKMFACIIPTEGAPFLRFLQRWAAMRPVLPGLYLRAWHGQSAFAQAFPNHALRKEREGSGTHCVGDGGNIKSWAARQRPAGFESERKA